MFEAISIGLQVAPDSESVQEEDGSKRTQFLSRVLRPTLAPDEHNRHQWWEEFWAREPERFGQASQNFLQLLKSHICATNINHAVDIGSGNGRYAIELAKMGFDTDAVEWTRCGLAEMLRNARKQKVRINCQRINFINASHEPRDYGLVLSSGLLEELPRREQIEAIIGHVRWTRNGGYIAMKYCIEIERRGTLVDSELAPEILKQFGAKILHYSADKELKISKSDMLIRTATIIAQAS